MATQTILVTGSTAGIGRATAIAAGSAGARVIVHGRDESRVTATVEEVAVAGAASVQGVTADLGDPVAVADLARRAEAAGVTVLVNNAGVYCRERTETADGIELTWAVNHLNPSLLTVLLLDGLLDRGGRVVNVSAHAHVRARFDLTDPQFKQRRYSHFHAYANSKLANLAMVREFARRLGPDAPVDFLAVHPGVVGTRLLTEGMGVEGQVPAETAGESLAAVALAESWRGSSGTYLDDGRPMAPEGPGLDDDLAAAIYDLTMSSLGFD